jgi:F0F1-type ATP synthase alpha subunit
MSKNELIEQIEQLPIQDRIYLVEKVVHSIRAQAEQENMTQAAESLYQDYKNYKELTAFTDIDLDNFYETRLNLTHHPCPP